jgi:hypothetical protein
MKPLLENWQDTSWSAGGRRFNTDPIEKVTIGTVIDYLSTQEPIDINVLEFTRHIPPGGALAWEYDPERVAAASLEYPIIIVKSTTIINAVGQDRYVLDGNHRLQKAVNKEIESIKAKILDLDSPETPEEFKRMFGGDPARKTPLPKTNFKERE